MFYDYYEYFGRCPECDNEIVRLDKLRYRFCSGAKCGALLGIPSYKLAADRTFAVYIYDNGARRKITRSYYSELAKKILRRYDNMGKIGSYITEFCPCCGKYEFIRYPDSALDYRERCPSCGQEIVMPKDLTEPLRVSPSLPKIDTDNEEDPWDAITEGIQQLVAR